MFNPDRSIGVPVSIHALKQLVVGEHTHTPYIRTHTHTFTHFYIVESSLDLVIEYLSKVATSFS